MQSPSHGDRGEELEVTSGRSSPGAEPSSLWPKGRVGVPWGAKEKRLSGPELVA